MLSMQEALQTAFTKRLSLSGRSSRSEFWWLYLVSVPCFIVATYIARMGFIFSLLGLALSLATFAMVIACMVRRMHDRNFTGWLVLIIFVPTFGILILLLLCTLKGTEGPNNYGEDPLQRPGSPGSNGSSGSGRSHNIERNGWGSPETEDTEFQRKLRGFFDKDNDKGNDGGSFKP
ncbi:DUF805 domain-containing protein [Anaerobiospirillum sp. NML120449]|uniref:DUF805 domain-containing protein n=1 Tax=Anaerobiospirillum sp. NML120449 TaxID=2932817 RepID=UPI001FF61D7D|nr:DUF805 domain-containing protein [Anaerobiospirillum sp. NML120449]MCK0526678.1 DUF805 domain-containing protein [Anaerobiospirillum sp. NML120449]